MSTLTASRRALFCCVSLWLAAVPASEPLPLIEPLTLEFALALVDEPHPDMAVAQAQIDRADAEQQRVAANTDARLDFQAEARRVDPSPLAPDQSADDSRAFLTLSKPLYDFGRTRANLAASVAAVSGSEFELKAVRAIRRLEIMQRFFDVLIADFEFRFRDEDMSIDFIRMDRAQDRRGLGQVSDVDLLEATAAYEAARARRMAAQAAQRSTRARLAEVLHRPGQLPSTLELPQLPADEREPPPLDEIITQALDRNARVRALRARVAAAQERVVAARAGRRPNLSGNVEVSEHNRDFGSRETWRAGVILDVPLYSGSRVDADIAAAHAELALARAELAQGEALLRQDLVDTWQRIGALAGQRREARAQTTYRELYLDRSRALYELEVRTDLGDAMVRWSEARLAQARADFAYTLAWARLATLSGRPDLDPLAAPMPATEEQLQ